MLRRKIGFVVGIGLAAGCCQAYAQSTPQGGTQSSGTQGSTIETVIVTAEKRSENVERLPNAISVLTPDTLTAAGIGGVGTLQQVSPSVVFTESAGEPHVDIRGIGNELINIGAESAVSISQDGVPLASPLMNRREFLDIGSVEVLRGPQGTVSGRNSPGGAINIYSAQPTDTPMADLMVGYGNFNRWQASAIVNGPLVGNTLTGRLAVSYVRDDGWLRNTCNSVVMPAWSGPLAGLPDPYCSYPNKNMMTTNYLHYRGSLLYRPSDAFEVSLILDAFNDWGFDLAGVDGGPVNPGVPSLSEYYLGHPSFDMKNLTFQQNSPGPYTKNGQQATLRAVWDTSSTGKLTSTTAWQRYAAKGFRDYDAIPLPLANDYLEEGVDQYSEELTYTADLSDQVDLVFGGIFLEQHSREPFDLGGWVAAAQPGPHPDNVTWPNNPPFTSDSGVTDQYGFTIPFDAFQFKTHQVATSYGIYAQMRWKITDQLRLTIGDRFTRDSKTYEESLALLGLGTLYDLSAKGSWSANTPRFGLDYSPTDAFTLYANVARGFTAGGFNTFSGGATYKPEYVWSYEVGAKSFWLDRRLKVDLSIFNENFKDIQSVLFRVNPGGVVASLYVTNAGGASIEGVETSVEAAITDKFRLTASGTWLDAHYTHLESVDGSQPLLGTLNLAGNRLPRAPRWQANVGADYTIPITADWEVNLVANYAYQDKIYFNFFNEESMSQGAYGLLNVSAALQSTDGLWRISAFANNATDVRYWSNMQWGTGMVVPYSNGMIGEPRTYGIKLERHFE